MATLTLFSLARRIGRAAGRRVPPPWRVRRIDRSVLFDDEYYAAISGAAFSSRRAAVRHFLRHADDSVCHPLVEREWMDAMPDPNTTSPLFATEDGDAVAALERFLASAGDVAVLQPASGTGEGVTWGDARAALLAHARATTLQVRRAARRNARTLDRGEQRRQRAALGALPTVGPLVSIVLPTFNRAGSIGAAVQSVREQSYLDWELILVDDGSVDGTGEVIAALAAADERIRPLVLAGNRGVSAARNAGLAAAKGELVAFLDSDNRWRRDFLAVSVAVVEATGAAAVYSAVEVHLDRGVREFLGAPATRDELLDGRNQVDLSALVVARAALDEAGGFDEEIRRWVDYDLVLRLARRVPLRFIPIVGLDYDHRTTVGDRITTTESPRWRSVVIEKNLVDWDELRAARSSRTAGGLSAIVLVRAGWQRTRSLVDELLLSHDGDVEVVVVDDGSPRQVSAILTAAYLDDGRVTVLRLAGDLASATCVNIGFSRTTGDTVVVHSGRDYLTLSAADVLDHRGFDPLEPDDELRLRD